jgi:HSP20 family molecular chaperone IbpA
MNVRELVPSQSHWPFSREFLMHRNDEMDPLLTLHREMNRVFEEVFRGTFYSDPAAAPFGRHGIDQGNGWQGSGWPHIEVAKTGKDMKVIAELPGLDEKDERVELSNHVLTIDGEKELPHQPVPTSLRPHPPLLTEMRFVCSCAFADLGRVTVRTPFRNDAPTLSSSMSQLSHRPVS